MAKYQIQREFDDEPTYITRVGQEEPVVKIQTGDWRIDLRLAEVAKDALESFDAE